MYPIEIFYNVYALINFNSHMGVLVSQSPALLAIFRGNHRWPMDSPRKMASKAESDFMSSRVHGVYSVW